MLEPHNAERLCKLLGKLGTDSDHERAVAGRLADEFVKSLGLRWSDIVAPNKEIPRCDWRWLAAYCYERRGELFGKSRQFIENIYSRDRERDLTAKQFEWLRSIYDRLRKGEL